MFERASGSMVVTFELLQRAVAADEDRDEVGWPGARGPAAGVSYCSSTPPTLRIAMRSPSFTASSMSWVTNTIVLRSSLQPAELVLQPGAGDRVDGAERFVHQQHRRVGGERAGDADALLLATRELVRDSGRGTARDRGRRASRSSSTRASMRACPTRAARHRRDVVLDRLVREQTDLLDHVADATPQLRPDRRA